MPVYTSCEVKKIDERALRAALLSKGLVPRSRKWNEVRFRIQHRFTQRT